MATQGLITITEGGRVRAKIITGWDGSNMPALAESLRRNPTRDLRELMIRAKEHDLGGPTLFVMTSPFDWLCDEDPPEELPALYVEKFAVVDFNPRWPRGTAEYTERVELDTENNQALPEGGANQL